MVLLAQGYLPPDDSLRHAAKAVDARPWSEILVLRPGLLGDPHAAWHALLRGLHLATGWGPEGLVAFAVLALFLLTMAAPLPWFKAPDAWIIAWVLVWVAGGSQIRPLLGRPYLFAMAALLALLALNTRNRSGPLTRALLSTALFAAAALLHGSWYLLALIPIAFLGAGRWRDAARLCACFAVGCLAAALLTGHPLDFLAGQVLHLLHAVSPSGRPQLLVPEFRPSLGGGLVAAALLGVLLIQIRRGREARSLADPIFILALLGWLLGLKFKRFWIDWGYPSAVLWLAFQLEPSLVRLGRQAPLRRLALATAAGLAAILLISTGDEGRWSEPARTLPAAVPGAQSWLPEAGGILYASDMALFYDLYFQNPHGKWRYMVGFEPTMMPPEDLATFQNILLEPDNPAAYAPWIVKLRPQDRLFLRANRQPQSVFPGLQWYRVERNLWSGRKPA